MKSTRNAFLICANKFYYHICPCVQGSDSRYLILGLFVMHRVLLKMISNRPMKCDTNEYDLIEEFVAVMWKKHSARKLKEKAACEVSDDDGCTRL